MSGDRVSEASLRWASARDRVRDRLRPWHAPAPAAGAPVVGIIGAGAAGMAAAVMMRVRGNRPILFDAASQPGGSWERRYDSLRLNTVRWMSDLPGMRMPRSAGRWPDRDTTAAYLRAYARWHRLEIRTGTPVSRVAATPSGWQLCLEAGESERVDAVVVATGHARSPSVPDWPGRDDYRGTLIHSSSYRRPDSVSGRRVLVVGGGSSGAEIATELVRAGLEVSWSLRSMPHVFQREAFGLPTTPVAALGDLAPDPVVDAGAWIGERMIQGRRDYLPAPQSTVTERLRRCREPIVVEGLVPMLREGRLRVVGPVEGLTRRGASLSGGAMLEVDTVVAATGFDPDLEDLVGHLGVLGPRGLPHSVTPIPGLGFIGYRIPLAGTLWAVEEDAIRLARSLAIVPERPAPDQPSA